MWCYEASRTPPKYLEHHQIILLSYVPSIEAFSTQQIMYPISLKKLNVFEDNELAVSEEVEPVLDSVLYIPKAFRINGLA